MKPLSQERLKQIVHYDPLTGNFTRIECKARPDVIGVASSVIDPSGYTRIAIDGGRYYRHRLAWLYVAGYFPALEIDHINGNRADNRWINLRAVPRKTNAQNFRKARIDSRSGVLGVSWDPTRNKWVARIKIDSAYKFLGRFDDKECAATAYIEAKRQHHAGCTI